MQAKFSPTPVLLLLATTGFTTVFPVHGLAETDPIVAINQTWDKARASIDSGPDSVATATVLYELRSHLSKYADVYKTTVAAQKAVEVVARLDSLPRFMAPRSEIGLGLLALKIDVIRELLIALGDADSWRRVDVAWHRVERSASTEADNLPSRASITDLVDELRTYSVAYSGTNAAEAAEEARQRAGVLLELKGSITTEDEVGRYALVLLGERIDRLKGADTTKRIQLAWIEVQRHVHASIDPKLVLAALNSLESVLRRFSESHHSTVAGTKASNVKNKVAG